MGRYQAVGGAELGGIDPLGTAWAILRKEPHTVRWLMRFTSFVAPASTSVIPATRTVIWIRMAPSTSAFTPPSIFDWGEAELPRTTASSPGRSGATLLVAAGRVIASSTPRSVGSATPRCCAWAKISALVGKVGDLLSLYPGRCEPERAACNTPYRAPGQPLSLSRIAFECEHRDSDFAGDLIH